MTKISKDRFIELIEPLYPRLERYAISVCRDRDEAKDVVGETMLTAFEQFDKLKDEQALLGFLFTVASRVRVTMFRKAKRNRYADPARFDDLQSETQSPEIAVDIKLLFAAMDKLGDKQREAIVMHDITGLSYKEIAKAQNSSLVSVKLRIHRGRKKLASLLGVEDNSSEKSHNLNLSETRA